MSPDNQEQTIRAAYTVTKSEIIHAARYHYGLNLGRPVAALLLIFLLLLTALAFFIALIDPKVSYVGALFFGGLTVGCFFRDQCIDWLLGLSFEKRPDAGATVEWEFSPETVKTRWGGLASSEMQWRVFFKVVEMRDGILFYPSPKLSYWLPSSAFLEAEAIAIARQYGEAQGVTWLLGTH